MGVYLMTDARTIAKELANIVKDPDLTKEEKLAELTTAYGAAREAQHIIQQQIDIEDDERPYWVYDAEFTARIEGDGYEWFLVPDSRVGKAVDEDDVEQVEEIINGNWSQCPDWLILPYFDRESLKVTKRLVDPREE